MVYTFHRSSGFQYGTTHTPFPWSESWLALEIFGPGGLSSVQIHSSYLLLICLLSSFAASSCRFWRFNLDVWNSLCLLSSFVYLFFFLLVVLVFLILLPFCFPYGNQFLSFPPFPFEILLVSFFSTTCTALYHAVIAKASTSQEREMGIRACSGGLRWQRQKEKSTHGRIWV